jgi:putative oxidoreductase
MWGTVYSVARFLMPLLFIYAGITKFMNVGGIARALQASGLPMPQIELFGLSRFALLGYLVALIEVVCGVMVALGYRTRAAALVLALFTVATIVVGHPFWTMDGAARAANLTQALKNLSIISGLLIVAALGPGRHALDNRGRG